MVVWLSFITAVGSLVPSPIDSDERRISSVLLTSLKIEITLDMLAQLTGTSFLRTS